MKKYLACGVLCTAIMLISLGIHTANIIITSIGGALAGVYNAMMYQKD
jgi:hypothetical protein